MSAKMTITPADGVWVVRAGGAVLAESRSALQLDEDGHASVIYFPRGDVATAFLEPSATRTHCPHKGEAGYFGIAAATGLIADAAWAYAAPVAGAETIAGHFAFDTDKVTVERL